jgi:hypothetical protein
MKLKQVKIDNGQLGGVLQMVNQSMFIFNFLTFITNIALFYESIMYKYVSFRTGAIIMMVCVICWWITYYTIIYPSMIRFANRQTYKHGNPIRSDIEDLRREIILLREVIR